MVGFTAKQSEGLMTAEVSVTQAGSTNTGPTSWEEDAIGLPTASGVEDGTNTGDGEPFSEEISAFESAGAHDPAVVTGADERVADAAGTQLGVNKKKKKKSKRAPKSRRGITGFEEYYADAPMTPAEYLEKKKLYDPARPFHDRIEECIQRFRARRRMDSRRTGLFNKYLFLGGIDASQRQFTGIGRDIDAMAEADPEQIRNMTAVDFVGHSGSRFYDGGDSEDWEVDFEAVVKGFLSRTMIDTYMYDEEAIQLAADLIKNFLNYVLIQDVCPEYHSNIIAARNVCDIAPTELRYMHKVRFQLPGPFNLAARSLFCESGVANLEEDKNWEALMLFRLTAFLSPLNQEIKQYTNLKVVSTREQAYRVLEIDRLRQKDKKMINEQMAAMNLDVEIRPAGCVRVAPTLIAHGWGNIPRPEEVDFSEAKEVDLLLEEEILSMLEIGMKMRLTICELNIGLCFIKEVHDLRVSFDTFLPQYLMSDWKDPVPNDRLPPSVHDPSVEEKAMGAEMLADD